MAGRGIEELDERPLSSRQRYAIVLIALGEFIDGYDLIVMGAALILLRPQFDLTPAQIGLLGAASFIGAALGMVMFGDLCDRLGRRAIFIANLLFFVVFSILTAFVTSLPQLFIARFFVGLGVGMDVPTSTAYVAEVAPRRQRGVLLGTLINLTWVLGAMCSNLIALPLIRWTGPAAWRWMFGLAAVPALVVLIGRQILPESPRWLIGHGRVEDARRALASFGVEADAQVLAELGTPRGSCQPVDEVLEVARRYYISPIEEKSSSTYSITNRADRLRRGAAARNYFVRHGAAARCWSPSFSFSTASRALSQPSPRLMCCAP